MDGYFNWPPTIEFTQGNYSTLTRDAMKELPQSRPAGFVRSEPMSIDCALGCGNPVNPHDLGTWKEVSGFVGGPKSDSMRLRNDTGRYAHDACVQKLQEGQAVDQPSLFDTDEATPIPRDGGISGTDLDALEGL